MLWTKWQVSSVFAVAVANGMGGWFCGHKLIQFRWNGIKTAGNVPNVHLVEARAKALLEKLHKERLFGAMFSKLKQLQSKGDSVNSIRDLTTNEQEKDTYLVSDGGCE